ncbi:hypothetical protein OHB39_39490 [Streptomyces sp. NBC_00047]|uniref:hypothetical protein n=1 Tax=Streptomyces sp. NBC_00047 TaxID=2975627 RepID=UPI00224CA912|nr:hypothetical protein [Streptomyces sp. NBC_00047]MCX5613525.1 hypothetical protein [Streptomyces sp. NBC_00047]
MFRAACGWPRAVLLALAVTLTVVAPAAGAAAGQSRADGEGTLERVPVKRRVDVRSLPLMPIPNFPQSCSSP